MPTQDIGAQAQAIEDIYKKYQLQMVALKKKQDLLTKELIQALERKKIELLSRQIQQSL